MPESPFVYLCFQYEILDAVYEELVWSTIFPKVAPLLCADSWLGWVVLLGDLCEESRGLLLG